MKTIENKQTDINDGPESKMTYFGLLKLIINTPNKEGFNVEQMRQRLKIWGTIDTAKNDSNVGLELNDFNVTKEAVNKFGWAIIHKDIVSFVDYINSL